MLSLSIILWEYWHISMLKILCPKVKILWYKYSYSMWAIIEENPLNIIKILIRYFSINIFFFVYTNNIPGGQIFCKKFMYHQNSLKIFSSWYVDMFAMGEQSIKCLDEIDKMKILNNIYIKTRVQYRISAKHKISKSNA